MEQSQFDSGRLSPPRPSTLMLDNGQAMELDNDYRDLENNQIINYSPPTQIRNKKKKKRAADIPVKKFIGELQLMYPLKHDSREIILFWYFLKTAFFLSTVSYSKNKTSEKPAHSKCSVYIHMVVNVMLACELFLGKHLLYWCKKYQNVI